MNSSRTAQAALLGLWFVATLTLMSAQWRVIAKRAPRWRRYVVGWIVSSLHLASVLSMMDRAVGTGGVGRVTSNVALVACVSALSLATAEWWMRSRRWARLGGTLRYATLVAVHALVLLVTGYFLV